MKQMILILAIVIYSFNSYGQNKLTNEEKTDGFELLFNGNNLNGWVGNKTDYVAEDGMIIIYPDRGGKGNIFTEKEYANFIFRFEFQLTPGANNGLGIRTAIDAHAAYDAIELQIIDNTADKYKKLDNRQYHGSVYGVVAAKRGFLKPVGEWNSQEVIYDGFDIKVILNGETIIDTNIKKARKLSTMDDKAHPGLKNKIGHIGFLGHGDIVKFRRIRVKEL